MQVIITSPSVDIAENVSGISAVTRFITSYNTGCRYTHFTLGKKDSQKRNLRWLLSFFGLYARWLCTMVVRRDALIHFNIAFDKRGLIRDSPLIITARLLGRRVIVHIHGGEFLTAPLPPQWFRRLASIVLRSGPVIVLSGREQKRLEEYVTKSTIFVLPNCISVQEAAAFERTFADCEPLRLLFLGRIEPNKGIDVLYAALEEAKARGVPFRFALAGSGPAEKTYVELFRNLLGSDFEFLGVVEGEKKLEVLKDCDVFVLPSRFEGLPIALLECMAFGLVPIITDVGSMASVALHGSRGLIVDRPESQAVVDALCTLVGDREYLHTLSRNCREYILETCRTDRYISELNRVYQHG